MEQITQCWIPYILGLGNYHNVGVLMLKVRDHQQREYPMKQPTNFSHTSKRVGGYLFFLIFLLLFASVANAQDNSDEKKKPFSAIINALNRNYNVSPSATSAVIFRTPRGISEFYQFKLFSKSGIEII